MDSETMRQYILNFSLDTGPHGNQGYNRVLLQLFGYTGHGKSSLINSFKYVVDNGQYKTYASVASASEGPHTMKRNSYKLTEVVTLVDNRGCVKMNKDETGEIYVQLGNFIPLDTEVNWQTGYEDMMNKILESEKEEHYTDFIVPILVYSVEKGVAEDEVRELKEILMKARNITGIFPTVVLTHELSTNLPDVKEKFRRTGARNIFPLENYTASDHLKTRGKHNQILQCLYEALKDVEFRMGEKRDPVNEKIERKRILFSFAHERQMEKEKEAQERLRKQLEEEERRRRELEQNKSDSCILL
ncbi:uncharacterized protein WCC33_014313 [Rhinophrynus dorsalis]